MSEPLCNDALEDSNRPILRCPIHYCSDNVGRDAMGCARPRIPTRPGAGLVDLE